LGVDGDVAVDPPGFTLAGLPYHMWSAQYPSDIFWYVKLIEQKNSKSVYVDVNDPGTCCWYGPDEVWWVGPTTKKDVNEPWGWLHSKETGVTAPHLVQEWNVFVENENKDTDGVWELQPHVVLAANNDIGVVDLAIAGVPSAEVVTALLKAQETSTELLAVQNELVEEKAATKSMIEELHRTSAASLAVAEGRIGDLEQRLDATRDAADACTSAKVLPALLKAHETSTALTRVTDELDRRFTASAASLAIAEERIIDLEQRLDAAHSWAHRYTAQLKSLRPVTQNLIKHLLGQ
jgi:hypothetical protein